MHWVPCKQLRHHRGSQWKRPIAGQRHHGEKTHCFKENEFPGHWTSFPKHHSWKQRTCRYLRKWMPTRNISGCEFIANAPPSQSKFLWCTRKGWSTSVRKSISIHQGTRRTAEELNEILIRFIHSLNRPGHYNLPNTKIWREENSPFTLKKFNPMGTTDENRWLYAHYVMGNTKY